MSKLQAALAWAARGFRVFPLLPNSKKPIYEGSWYEHATSDPVAIRSMWTMPVVGGEYDYNIGVDCTDHVVVDIDVKEYVDARDGQTKKKDGINQYGQLGGTYDTLVVVTPSGGFHCYFEGPDSANVNIARDIEIRSHHGYVVAPGSTIDGVPYQVVTDKEPSYVPFTVEKLLRPVYVRSDFAYEDDNPANIQMAINFLTSCPPAIEGQRGDETTFMTAARLVREMALSPGKAFELLCDYYNPRCEPPWAHDELMGKVENAAAYASADAGRLDPAVVFAGIDIEPPPSPYVSIAAAWGNAVRPAAITPRPWLYHRFAMRRKVTGVAAAGSTGKSSLGLTIAAHGAQGLDLGPFKCEAAFRTVIFNGEDDIEEQSRRLEAICNVYNFDFEKVRENVMLLSYEELELKLVEPAGRGSKVNEAAMNWLVDLTSDPSVGLLVLDPIVDIHNGDEGDSSHMNMVMATLQNVARLADVALLAFHHTVKGGDNQENRIGNADVFRGSSAIINKCRVAFTLMDASASDVELYGIQDGERHAWARLDDAKMNLTLKDDKPIWFKKTGVKILSGDVVGAMKITELTKSTMHLRLRLADVLIQTMEANGSGSMTMLQAVSVLKGGEPIMANKKDAEVKSKLIDLFSTAVDVRGKTIHVIKDGNGFLVTLK